MAFLPCKLQILQLFAILRFEGKEPLLFFRCLFLPPPRARSDAPGFGWCGLFSFSPWSSKMSRLSWECACTFTNDVDAVFCSCCDAPKPRTEASVEAPENLQAASEGEQRSKRPRVTRELTFKESAERVAEVLSSPAYGRFGNIFSPANAFLGIPSSGATSSRAKPAEKELQSATASVQPAVGESVQSSENQAVSPENASDVGSKGAKKTLNYGAVVGLAARARQFPDDFVIRGDSLWCVSCHKPVTHERKSSVDSHLSSAAHKQAKAAKPPSVTQRSPSSTAPPLSSNAGTPVTPYSEAAVGYFGHCTRAAWVCLCRVRGHPTVHPTAQPSFPLEYENGIAGTCCKLPRLRYTSCVDGGPARDNSSHENSKVSGSYAGACEPRDDNWNTERQQVWAMKGHMLPRGKKTKTQGP